MNSMQDCCFKAFVWEGTPSGREGKLGDHNAYIAGDNKNRAIFMVHDALGWGLKNTRMLADHYAKEVGATVYLPDFFHGAPIDEKDITLYLEDGQPKMDMNPNADYGDWWTKNSPENRVPEILSCARKLREQYSWIGMVGFCWGGLVGFRLASKANSSLFNAISIAHPAQPTEQDVRDISVPFQIIAPEHDITFSPEWREFCNKEIPKLGVDYHFQHFPGMLHGFTTKTDVTKENDKRALEQAKNAVVYWFVTHK